MIELDTIYNEDCLQGMKRIPDESIDLIVTSPPYDNLRKYGGVEWNFDKFKDIAAEISRIMKHGGVCVWVVGDATINGSETCTSFYQVLHFKDVCGLNLYDTMLYMKGNPIPLNQRRYEQMFEYMFVFSKGIPNTFNPIKEKCKRAGQPMQWGRTINTGERMAKCLREDDIQKVRNTKLHGNVFTYGVGGNHPEHPAVFPEKLAIDQISTWSKECDLVLDPFMGSGTTAIACTKLNRHFIGFEINNEYYTKSMDRIWNEQRQLKLF